MTRIEINIISILETGVDGGHRYGRGVCTHEGRKVDCYCFMKVKSDEGKLSTGNAVIRYETMDYSVGTGLTLNGCTIDEP